MLSVGLPIVDHPLPFKLHQRSERYCILYGKLISHHKKTWSGPAVPLVEQCACFLILMLYPISGVISTSWQTSTLPALRSKICIIKSMVVNMTCIKEQEVIFMFFFSCF